MLWALEDELEIIFYMSPISLNGMVVVVPQFLGLDYGAADLLTFFLPLWIFLLCINTFKSFSMLVQSRPNGFLNFVLANHSLLLDSCLCFETHQDFCEWSGYWLASINRLISS